MTYNKKNITIAVNIPNPYKNIVRNLSRRLLVLELEWLCLVKTQYPTKPTTANNTSDRVIQIIKKFGSRLVILDLRK